LLVVVACGADLTGLEKDGPIYLMTESAGCTLPYEYSVTLPNGDRVRYTLRSAQVQFRKDSTTASRFELAVDSAGRDTVINGRNGGYYWRARGDTIIWCAAACSGAPLLYIGILTEEEVIVPPIISFSSIPQEEQRYVRYHAGR
jgi:hypothetical protein